MRAAGTLWALGRTAGDLLFPPVCVHCGAVVEGGGLRHLCARCGALIVRVRPPHCDLCGRPFDGEAAENRRCPQCAETPAAFDAGRTCVLLQGPGRSLVHTLKYHRGVYVLADVAAIARTTPGLPGFLRGARLVPVPLHPRKERERGYNQSRLLAGAFADAAGPGTVVAELLRRVVDTPSQTALDRRTRQENLKNAFALRKGVAINPTDHLILVDDVYTTGSTLNACAAALRHAGCVNLGVVTFGHG